jgi:large subunit ribosomal protein L9
MKRANRHVAVILDQDVEGTGFSGELLQVKPGFARNYLLPKQLASLATPKLQADRQKQIEAAIAKREQEVTARQELAEQLHAEPVTVKLKVGPDGQVFGSVTATMLTAALKSQRKLTVDAKQLAGLPLKRLGNQHVSARLGLGVTALINVQVDPEHVKPDPDDPEAK